MQQPLVIGKQAKILEAANLEISALDCDDASDGGRGNSANGERRFGAANGANVDAISGMSRGRSGGGRGGTISGGSDRVGGSDESSRITSGLNAGSNRDDDADSGSNFRVNGETDCGTIGKVGCGSRSSTECGTLSDAGNVSNIVTGIGSNPDGDRASNLETANGAIVGADSETGGGNNSNIGIRLASTAQTTAHAFRDLCFLSARRLRQTGQTLLWSCRDVK